MLVGVSLADATTDEDEAVAAWLETSVVVVDAVGKEWLAVAVAGEVSVTAAGELFGLAAND